MPPRLARASPPQRAPPPRGPAPSQASSPQPPETENPMNKLARSHQKSPPGARRLKTDDAMLGQQQVGLAANCQFFACFEDSSFIYRHRKRPRSGESPFDSSPASSTTTDSMLTNSFNFSDFSESSHSCSQRSSTSSGRGSSKSLSPPPLTFDLLSTNSPAGSRPRPSAAGSPERAKARPHRRAPAHNDENKPQQATTTTSSTAATAAVNIHTARQQAEHEDERVFHNLILRERRFELARAELGGQVRPALSGQLRHSLLSWMLRICEHQLCQDEIFPLATMILDSFLLANPMILIARQDRAHPRPAADHNDPAGHQRPAWRAETMGALHDDNQDDDNQDDDDDEQPLLDAVERELQQRQLVLFAACSLLLATKLRQTPRLYIQTLVEFSRPELPVELGRGEIVDAELLMLSVLKWDLASLVTPNEFLQELLARKCQPVLLSCLEATTDERDASGQDGRQRGPDAGNKCKLVNRVSRHMQTLLELCLMDSELSQYPASILAMSSMAVAINGLSETTKDSCFGLEDIVAQIHEATDKVNETEKYVQTLLHSTSD